MQIELVGEDAAAAERVRAAVGARSVTEAVRAVVAVVEGDAELQGRVRGRLATWRERGTKAGAASATGGEVGHG